MAILRRLWARARSLAAARDRRGESESLVEPPAPPAEDREPVIAPGPFISPGAEIVGLETVASIHPTARLFVRERNDGALAEMRLGEGVYLGKEVELLALNNLTIGADTSIQDYCVFHGDISIGAHCLFASHVLISSTSHRFKDEPAWLIRDQDEARVRSGQPRSKPISIGDDCWIGWSVAIMPGVEIGRGAVIGSNCVVTRDVAPYEIHGSAPNRRIGLRLAFSPPTKLIASDDACLPYFYSGFRLAQIQLRESRRDGVVIAEDRAMLVLAHSRRPRVRLVLARYPESGELSVDIWLNGSYCGRHHVGLGLTEIEVGQEPSASSEGAPAPRTVPRTLQEHTCVELAAAPSDGSRRTVGIASAELSN